MKSIFTPFFFLSIFLFASIELSSQSVSTFENLLSQPGTYWNGSDLSGGFYSGNGYFENRFDTSFGGSWSGFVYSDMTDDTTSGFLNQYSAITGVGVNNSNSYGLFYYSPYNPISRLKLLNPDSVMGFYVTNSTWAALSMKNGDSFSKKFGGTSGNDPDWLKLSIAGYYNGSPINDTIEYYLADFRFSNNSMDYILKTWDWVNLMPLGMTDSLEFWLSSSDTGIYGMNTPAYFCMDNFTTRSNFSLVKGNGINSVNINIYPNPVSQYFIIDNNSNKDFSYQIYDMMGNLFLEGYVIRRSHNVINAELLPKGAYIIKANSAHIEYHYKIFKL